MTDSELLRVRRVTLSDVAAHAKVSRATASLVLRGSGSLTPETRIRVRRSMNELGYVYNRGAAALRAQRSQSVGVIVPDISIGFTAELTTGFESALTSSNMVSLIGTSSEDLDHQDLLVKSMLERQVDGLLLMPAVGTKRSLLEYLESTGVPTVVVARELPYRGLPYIGIDNLNAGKAAGRHLLFHGAERVAFLGGLEGLRPRSDRAKGLRSVLEEGGAQLVADIPGPPRGSFGLETAARLLREGDFPDSIVCHNDVVAFGVYRALRKFAPAASTSVRVISHDDIESAALWEPPLTTVAARGKEIGVRTADVMLRRIADPTSAPERVLLTSELLVRESCGCRPDNLG